MQASQVIKAICVLCLSVLPAEGASVTQPKFQVLYNPIQYGQPTSITQFTPSSFFWANRYYILSLSIPSGAVTQLAAAPNGCTTCDLTLPVTASNGRGYSLLGGNSSDPIYALSFDLKPNGMIDYPSQTFFDVFTANLPDGRLLGNGGNGSGGYYIVTSDLDANTTPLNHQFPSDETVGAGPIYASDGNYYGISMARVRSGYLPGYLYQLTPAGAFTRILTMPFATSPPESLIQGSDGNFYGLAQDGGANGYGAFYQVTMSGQYTLLYSFTDYAYPGNLLQASDGNFYGITNIYNTPPTSGEIFQLTKSGQYTPIYHVDGQDGGSWFTSLIQGSDGRIYGTCTAGGTAGGGTIFALDIGLPKPAPQALHFSPAEGKPGDKIRIWGYNLLEPSVTFNGVAAPAATS